MVQGELYHVASKEALQDFWDMDLDFTQGGGLIVLKKQQCTWEGDEQYNFIALCQGGGDNWEKYAAIRKLVKAGELINGSKENQFGSAKECVEKYKVILESCCFSHYRDIEVSMGTSGYTMQSIGSRSGHRTERSLGLRSADSGESVIGQWFSSHTTQCQVTNILVALALRGINLVGSG